MKKYKHKTNGSLMTYKDGCMKIENLVIEGAPNLDYWEEVIEKDYEILSFTSKLLIYTVRENGRLLWDIPEYKGMNADNNSTHWTEAIEKGYKIYSVKRLSDGEVFSIGDLCNPIGKYYNNRHTITKIEFCKAGYLRIQSHNWYVNIDGIEHSKKPLFTTEDGVDIYYEGDEYKKLFIIPKNTYTIKECNKHITRNPFPFSNNAIYFSTKEAAEEYILMNKPCLSINDVMAELNKPQSNTYIIKNLKEKIKNV